MESVSGESVVVRVIAKCGPQKHKQVLLTRELRLHLKAAFAEGGITVSHLLPGLAIPPQGM